MAQKGFYSKVNGEKRFILVQGATDERVVYDAFTVGEGGEKILIGKNFCLSKAGFERRFG